MTARTSRPTTLLTLIALVAIFAFAPRGAPPLRAQQTNPTLRGSQPGVLGPVALHAGVVIVRARSNGADLFTVALINQDPAKSTPVTEDSYAYKDFYPLFSASGRFDGAAAALLKTDDNYYLRVEYAAGPYELTFEQPTPTSVSPVDQHSFSGRNQQVTPVFRLPAGTITVTAQAGSSALQLWLYSIDDLGGSIIPSDSDPNSYDGRLFDSGSGETPGSVQVTIPSDGLYFFLVHPFGGGMLDWTVSIQ